MSSLKKCFRKKRRVGNTSSSFDAGGRIPPSGLPPVRRPLCPAGLRGHAGRKRLPPARADKSIISDSGGIARDYFLPGPAGARPVSAGGGKIDFFSMAGYTTFIIDSAFEQGGDANLPWKPDGELRECVLPDGDAAKDGEGRTAGTAGSSWEISMRGWEKRTRR
jgi:hypothetical protein